MISRDCTSICVTQEIIRELWLPSRGYCLVEKAVYDIEVESIGFAVRSGFESW